MFPCVRVSVVCQSRSHRCFVAVCRAVKKLGFPVETLRFHDVLSTDDWALDMVPGARAVLLLFPIKDATEKHRAEEAAKVAADGQVVR